MLDKPKPIGGSDVAGILGISPYSNAHDVYLRCWYGNSDDETPATKWGKLLEPLVIKEACAKLGVATYDTHPSAYGDGWGGGEGDAQVVLDGKLVGIEAKTVGPRGEKDWDGGVPDYVRSQCLWLCRVLEWDRCIVAVLFTGSREERLYTIERDDKLETAIFGKCKAFWNEHVLPQNPPPMEPLKGQREPEPEPEPTGEDIQAELGGDLAAQVAAWLEDKADLEASKLYEQRSRAKLDAMLVEHDARKVTLIDGSGVTRSVTKAGKSVSYAKAVEVLMAKYGIPASELEPFTKDKAASVRLLPREPKE